MWESLDLSRIDPFLDTVLLDYEWVLLLTFRSHWHALHISCAARAEAHGSPLLTLLLPGIFDRIEFGAEGVELVYVFGVF